MARFRIQNKDFDWREWAVLTEACALASIAVLPYAQVMSGGLKKMNEQMAARGKAPITMPRLYALALVQGHVTFGLASAIGLRLAPSMDMGPKHLDSLVNGHGFDMKPTDAARYAALGAVGALAISAIDRTVFNDVRQAITKGMNEQPGAWRSLLASFYGGIAEEVLMRLGLQTLLARGVRVLRHDKKAPPSGATMWPAILLSNIAFGAGHLPTTAAVTKLTPKVVARALVLNSLVGIVCGYLYWQESLEAGMVAHGAADLVLHVGGALTSKS